MPLDEAPQTENNGEEQTQTITIQGIEFVAGMPYKEGHVLNKAEAQALNQTYGENLRNNFASRIKKAQAEGLKAAIEAWKNAGGEGEEPKDYKLTPEQISNLQEEFDAYESDYEFNGKRGGRAPRDPVAAEARKIAKAKIMEKMKANNLDPKTVTEEKWVELIAQVLERNPKIREEAQRRIDSMKALAEDSIDVNLAA